LQLISKPKRIENVYAFVYFDEIIVANPQLRHCLSGKR